MGILTCQATFGMERGAQIEALVERATGGPCPCRVGATCPLLPPAPEAPPLLRAV